MAPLVGWRAWRFSGDGTLTSIHHPTRWQPGVPVEASHSPPLVDDHVEAESVDFDRATRRAVPLSAGTRLHEIPGADCTCGIYAVTNREHLETQFLWPSMPDVWGRVNLWGRVIVAERGYRAQYAYPAELWVAEMTVAEALEPFGVPVYLESKEDQ